jgi:uncharacterized protein YgfB (UPF0149 family)
MMQAEGWELQAGPAFPPEAEALAERVGELLGKIAKGAQAAADAAIIDAEALEPDEAAALARRRQLEPSERAALDRFRLAERWALGDAAPARQLLEADRERMADRLRLGWLLTTPEALDLVPDRDRYRIAALDAQGRPFAPDRLRVSLGQRIAALQTLGLPQLLQRFAAGEVIAATDPAVLAVHTTATTHRGQLAAAADVTPAKLPTGTLRALLRAVGWELVSDGRIKARGGGRDGYTYRAQRVALPEGVEAQALAARASAVHAAEAHGCLCGALCLRPDYSLAEWLDELLPEPAAAADADGPFAALFEESAGVLARPDMEFEPMLPDDDAPLESRVEALAAWCGGFLYGFGAAGTAARAVLPDAVTEVLADLAQLSQAGVPGAGEPDVEEDAYVELVEYLRAAVQLVYEELDALRSSQAVSRSSH